MSLSSFNRGCRRSSGSGYKESGYGEVILPFTVLRRLDCVLEPTKAT